MTLWATLYLACVPLLGHDDFTIRQAATVALIKFEKPICRDLIKLYDTQKDPEIRNRIKQICNERIVLVEKTTEEYDLEENEGQPPYQYFEKVNGVVLDVIERP